LSDEDVERDVHERDLQVGSRPARIGLAEERRLREVLASLRHRLRGFPDHAREDVVVEVLADARKRSLDVDAVVAELPDRADAREQEQVRRLDRARADDDFATRAYL